MTARTRIALRYAIFDRPHEGYVHVGTWRRRCTYCGHRVGLNVIETRRQPWRIPAELVMRIRAMRAGGKP